MPSPKACSCSFGRNRPLSSGKWTCPKEPGPWAREGSSSLASSQKDRGRGRCFPPPHGETEAQEGVSATLYSCDPGASVLQLLQADPHRDPHGPLLAEVLLGTALLGRASYQLDIRLPLTSSGSLP